MTRSGNEFNMSLGFCLLALLIYLLFTRLLKKFIINYKIKKSNYI